jgi:hypothetical protein
LLVKSIVFVSYIFYSLYHYRRQIQNYQPILKLKFSDLDEKGHKLNESMVELPELSKVVTNLASISLDAQYSFAVLNVWSHAYGTRERKILNDNEWFGRVHWMRNAFKEGTIKEHRKQIQRSECFDSAFEDFTNKEVISPTGKLIDEKKLTACIFILCSYLSFSLSSV